MKKTFPLIIFLSAILISVTSEYFSIVGLSQLFSGRQTEVIILAIAIGLGKLISISSVYRYWKYFDKNPMGKFLKYYLSIATFILIIITSIGVYGFLADAYQQTANVDNINQAKIELLKVKKSRFNDQSDQLKIESSQINESITLLRKSLSTDNQYQYYDKRSGQVLTQVQSTSKKGVQDQLDKSLLIKQQIDLRLSNIIDSIGYYDIAIIESQSNNSAGSELGPLKYISTLSGIEMDKIINVLMLILVIVIDPLAIALILTSQFGFRYSKIGRKTESLYEQIKYFFVKRPVSNDLQVTKPKPKRRRKKPVQRKSRASKTNPEAVKKVPNSRSRKVDHFNVEIDPIADPNNVLATDRTVVEKLNQTTSDNINKSLK